MSSEKSDRDFLKQLGVSSDSTPSTWERWEGDGKTLRMELAETFRQLYCEQDAHGATKRRLAMWKLAASIASGLLLLLIAFGRK